MTHEKVENVGFPGNYSTLRVYCVRRFIHFQAHWDESGNERLQAGLPCYLLPSSHSLERETSELEAWQRRPGSAYQDHNAETEKQCFPSSGAEYDEGSVLHQQSFALPQDTCYDLLTSSSVSESEKGAGVDAKHSHERDLNAVATWQSVLDISAQLDARAASVLYRHQTQHQQQMPDICASACDSDWPHIPPQHDLSHAKPSTRTPLLAMDGISASNQRTAEDWPDMDECAFNRQQADVSMQFIVAANKRPMVYERSSGCLDRNIFPRQSGSEWQMHSNGPTITEGALLCDPTLPNTLRSSAMLLTSEGSTRATMYSL